MKFYFIISFVLFVIFLPIANAALPFPGKENQEVVTDNGITCVPEDKFYWSEGYPCCSGLTPYLRADYAGQQSCTPVLESVFGNLIYHPVYRLVIVSAIVLLGIFIFRLKKKTKK